ncbi:MAG: PulJ/GspJ family protein [Gemmatimonadales bacterium]
MRGRHGFTVIELLIGLAVGGVVLVLAGAVMGQLAADAGRVVRVRDALDRRAEARAFLASAFRSLQVGQGDDDNFLGSAQATEFTARVETARGWFEPRRLVLMGEGGRVLLRTVGGDAITLFERIDALETQYLPSSGGSSEWLQGWHSPSTAPVAIRLIIWWSEKERLESVSDTLLFVIGSRG